MTDVSTKSVLHQTRPSHWYTNELLSPLATCQVQVEVPQALNLKFPAHTLAHILPLLTYTLGPQYGGYLYDFAKDEGLSKSLVDWVGTAFWIGVSVGRAIAVSTACHPLPVDRDP